MKILVVSAVAVVVGDNKHAGWLSTTINNNNNDDYDDDDEKTLNIFQKFKCVFFSVAIGTRFLNIEYIGYTSKIERNRGNKSRKM